MSKNKKIESFLVSLPLIKLWDQRSLIFHFSLMHIKLRYKGTNLGFIWAALEPLFYFVLLYDVFTSIRISTKEDFPIYLITGIIIYHLFSKGTIGGLNCLRSNQGILKTLSLNRMFFPIVSTAATTILMMVELMVFFSMMPFLGFSPSWTLLLYPLIIILLLSLVLGMSFFLSILYIRIPDIQPFWSVFVFTLLFMSPIFWSVDEASGILLSIQQINPVGQIIELAHQLVFYEIPEINDWLYTSSIIFSILVLGYLFFRKFNNNIVERL